MVLISYTSGSTTFTKAMWQAAPYNSPTEVELGEGWLQIGFAAFNQTAITSITIPSSVTEIMGHAFYQCSDLTSVTFADIENSDLGTIGTQAFRDSTLTSITIPASVTSIEDYAFYTTSLTSVTFIASTGTTTGGVIGITIGTFAFANANGSNDLASVFIKDGQVIKDSSGTAITTTLGTTGSFFGSSSSTVIRSYEIAGTGTFTTTHYTDALSPPYAVLTNSDSTGWTAIGDNAFGSTNITSIEIPTTVTTIGNGAFNSTALTSIIIPASVTSIGDYAFQNSSSLATVTFAADSGLNTIQRQAFQGTALTTIIIPASVISIGKWVFFEVTSLTTVTFIASTDSATGITIDAAAFSSTTALTTIYIVNGQKINGTDISSPGTMPNFYGHSDSVDLVVPTQSSAPPTQSSAPPAPICFPAGTPVLTDQGEVAIDKIDPKKHTIRANKIEGITETTSIENYLVMIKKDAFSRNVPCRDTTISANHKIMFNNQMIQAREFVDKKEFIDTIYKVDYTGETLYNVLLEDKHDLMIVNNLIAETLSPNSVNAWLFRKMESDISIAERKEVMDAYMQRVFPAPVLSLSSFMIGCK